jgi:hypothetical protein
MTITQNINFRIQLLFSLSFFCLELKSRQKKKRLNNAIPVFEMIKKIISYNKVIVYKRLLFIIV